MSDLAAQALVGVTGLFQDEPVTAVQGKAAAAVPKAWRAQVKEFLDQPRPKKFRAPKIVDHAEVAEDLSHGIDTERGNRLTSTIVGPGVGDLYLLALESAREYVRLRWPSLSRDTPAGLRLITPGKVEQGRAAAMLAVVEDPGVVLQELLSGTLTAEQAQTFRGVYPALFEMLRAMLDEELTERSLRDRDYEVGWARERLIRILFGLPPTMAISQVKPAPKAAAAPTIKIDIDPTREKTPAQRMAER